MDRRLIIGRCVGVGVSGIQRNGVDFLPMTLTPKVPEFGTSGSELAGIGRNEDGRIIAVSEAE